MTQPTAVHRPVERILLRGADIAVLLAVVALLVVALKHAFTGTLTTGDNASIELRVRDVGSSDTPLLGTYSRWGFHVPGPLGFYALALPYRLLGANSLHASAAVLSAGAILATAWTARMSGNREFYAAAVFAILISSRGMGIDLVDPWTPYIPVMWFPVFFFLCWRIALDRLVLAPAAFLVGSYLIQCHLQYSFLVAILLGWATALALASSARRYGAADGSRRQRIRRQWMNILLMLVAAFVLAWAPPIIQHFTDEESNVDRMLEYLRTPDSEPGYGKTHKGWAVPQQVGHALRLNGPWVRGDNSLEVPVTVWDAVLVSFVFASLAALALSLRRRKLREESLLAVTALLSVGGSLLLVSTLRGLHGPYLVRFLWPVAALVWLTIGWCSLQLAREVRPGRFARDTSIPFGALAILIAIALGFSVSGPVRMEADWFVATDAIEVVTEHLDPDDGVVAVVHRGPIGFVPFAVMAGLEREGYTVTGIPGLHHTLGERRTSRTPDVTIVIVEGFRVDAELEKYERDPSLGEVLLFHENPAGTTEARYQASASEALSKCGIRDTYQLFQDRDYWELNALASEECIDALDDVRRAEVAWLSLQDDGLWGRYLVAVEPA